MSAMDYGDPFVEWEEANAANEDGLAVMEAERAAAEQDATSGRQHGGRQRLVVIATDPEGRTVAVGPVGSRAAAVALRDTLERHGWVPDGDFTDYMSRAEWYRDQDAATPAAGSREQG